jgi:hypothetical protein
VAIYPPDGAGEDCGSDPPDSCGVPTNGPIELRFDRYLLPKTASALAFGTPNARQSISLFSGTRGNGIFLAPAYDVLERVVRFTPSFGGQLLPDTVYQVELPLPEKDPEGFGFRAFDGAPLEKGPVPLKWSFRTARAATPVVAAAEPPSCEQAVQIFAQGGCSVATCHAGRDAPLGLSLATTRDVLVTAISRVAHETSTSGTPGTVLQDPPRFGTGMPIIDPGTPSMSYLVYKLLENPGNFGPDRGCSETLYKVPLPAGTCLLAPEAERTRLAGWFVDGDSMPPGKEALAAGVADLRTLLQFIERSTDQCK